MGRFSQELGGAARRGVPHCSALLFFNGKEETYV